MYVNISAYICPTAGNRFSLKMGLRLHFPNGFSACLHSIELLHRDAVSLQNESLDILNLILKSKVIFNFDCSHGESSLLYNPHYLPQQSLLKLAS